VKVRVVAKVALPRVEDGGPSELDAVMGQGQFLQNLKHDTEEGVVDIRWMATGQPS
jgi:hypothetical protein